MSDGQVNISEIIKKPHVYRNGKYEEVVYIPAKYPRWMHHATQASIQVNSEQEEAALGEGWADSPAVHGIITAPDVEQLNKQKVSAAASASDWKSVLPAKPADISDHHVKFLQFHGRNDITTVEQVYTFLSSLNGGQMNSFMQEASAWTEPKRSPGRPKES